MLMTCAKDKMIKLWHFPPQWIDETGIVSAKPHVSEPPSEEITTFPAPKDDDSDGEPESLEEEKREEQS